MTEVNESRREIIKKIAVGSAAVAGLSVIPDKWTSPLIEFGTLPVHATTSGPTTVKIRWYVVRWRGNPNDKSKDRRWWTKIHGGDYKPWHRKFPLPRAIQSRSLRLEFEFSDGVKFTVPDSRRMAMNATGPKYTPQDPSERDPKKMHPSIAARLNTSPTWVRFRIVS